MSILSQVWAAVRWRRVHKALKSVVCIEVDLGNGEKATGTGFVIAPNRICTCRHVLKGAISVTIKTADGRTIEASAAQTHFGIIADMALIDVANLNLAPLEIDPNLPAVNENNTVFVPSRGRKGLRLGKGRLSFRDADELIFITPNLRAITQQVELAVVIKESQSGDSGSPVLTPDGKVRLMVNAYAPTAVVKFKDTPSARGLRLYAVTLCARMGSILADAEALGLTE